MNHVNIHIPPKKIEPLVIGNQVFRSFYDWTLTEKDIEKARRELGESEEKKEACLRELKKKLLEENMNHASIHIPPKKTEPLVIGNQVFRSFYDWTLTEKDIERARRELGESEEKKEACLRELKKKLLADENVNYRLDDAYLLQYLRNRKYDALKAYQNMKYYYDMRKRHPDFFTISPKLKSLQELNWVTYFPYTDEEGRVLGLVNFKRWNPYENSFEEMFQAAANVVDIGVMNPKIQINGFVILFDLSDLSIKHVSELLKNGRIWTYISLSLNAFPARIKKVIIFNTNTLVRHFYNMVKPFLKRKIAERVVLLGSDVNDIHQYVNPVLLPKKLNGSLEEEDCNISQFVLDNLAYIRYERSFTPLK